MKKIALSLMGLFLSLAAINPCSADDIKHTVVKGDTLWDISMKYLNTPWKWPLVWSENQNITNPHLIYPGDIVVITKDGDKTIIKIIPSPERGGPETKMTIYTPEEAAGVKGKSIFVSPQLSTYIYSPNILTGSGTVVKKIEGGELISQNDHIVIKTASAMKPDQAITLVSKMQDIKNGDAAAGYLYKAVATALVEEVQGDISKVVVKYSLQEARVGSVILDDIASVKPTTLTVSEPSVNGHTSVIDYYGGIYGSAKNDLVFIDAGRIQGVEKGAILNIARPIRYNGDEYKDRIFHENIGLILILQTLDNSSMGLLVESKAQVERGDAVVGRK